MNWTWWVLAGLPFPHLVRVMDCFFHEGIKVFYRISLAILILYQKHVPNTTSNATFGITNEVMASSSASSTTTTVANDIAKPNNLKLSKALDDKSNDIEMALPNFCRKLPVTPGKLLRTAFNIRALRYTPQIPFNLPAFLKSNLIKKIIEIFFRLWFNKQLNVYFEGVHQD